MKKHLLRFSLFFCIVSFLCISVFIFIRYTTIQVRADNVKIGKMNSYIKIRGEVELERKEKIFSKSAGVIKKINVSLGQKVQAGTKLIEMDMKDYDVAYKKASEDFNSANWSLQDVKNSIKQEDVEQAENQLEESEILLNSSKSDLKYKEDKFKNIEELYKNKAISEQDFKDAKYAVDIAQNALTDARKRVEIAETNLTKVKNALSAQTVKIAETKVEIAKSQIDDVNNKIKDSNVETNISGIIISKNIENGLYVSPGMLLFEVGDYSSAYIKADILSDDIGKVKIGQKVVISGGMLDPEKIDGEVYFIAPKAEKSISSLGVEQQRIEVRIKFDNKLKEFKPGCGFDLEIETAEKSSSKYVKDKAIIKKDDKNYVFVIQNGKANLINVQIGLENDDYTEILNGINENDVVIIDPSNELKQGCRVSYK